MSLPVFRRNNAYAEGTIYNTSMVGTTTSDKTEKLGITLPISLVKRADKARGDVPRSTFIRRAIEQFLRKDAEK